jgi:hypothetical protein
MDRIKHHADIHHWLTSKDFISVILFLSALYLIRFNIRFFSFFLIFGFCSISTTITQFFINNNSIALAFPWRTSVFIIPISSMIVVSHFISKIKFKTPQFNNYIIILFLFVCTFFYFKSHHIKNINLKFNEKLILVDKIKKHYNSIDRLLIPTNLEYIRMNSGLPIFIDWKHHAFKYNEIIKWKQRILLSNDFYAQTSHDNQSIQLKKIEKLENISHILLKKSKLYYKCNNLIDDDIFALISVKQCYYK